MQEKRKILFVVENAPIPGDPRVWKQAVTLREAGCQVSIIAPRCPGQPSQKAEDEMDGIFVYRFKLLEAQRGGMGYLLEYSLALCLVFWLSLKIWRRHGFDVIHVANPPDLFFLLALFYRCFGKKFVFDQHDLAPELFQVLFSAHGWARVAYSMLRSMELCSCRLADLVLVTNESFRDRVLERNSCSARKVRVVRNAPDLADFDGEDQIDWPFLPNRRRYVLAYVGMIGRQDGVENALYALHTLIYLYGREDVSAVFIGRGSVVDELQTLVQRLELDEYVHFTGWLGLSEVVRYLACADVGLVPDPLNGLNEFCTLHKVLDYMAASLPVVAFDLAETRVSAGEAALYARPNDCMDFARQLELLLNGAELRRNMGAEGRRRVVERFNWENSKKELLAAYEELFASEQSPALATIEIAKNP
ncbi:MAG TPA: glycosyltransferase family 4 protein [Ktedonobacteraceae bacterium]